MRPMPRHAARLEHPSQGSREIPSVCGLANRDFAVDFDKSSADSMHYQWIPTYAAVRRIGDPRREASREEISNS
jgi:hypothetical protein